MAIYRDKHTSNYAILGNPLTQHADLSPAALGVLTRLLPRPKDWVVVIEEVIASFDGRRGPVTRAFKELEEAGHLVRELDSDGNPVRPRGENGEYLPYEWDVYETPRKVAPQAANNSQAGKSESDTPQHESAESKPETGGAFSGFRARVYHDGFSHDGLSMMENRQLQSTNPKKYESDQIRKGPNKHTDKAPAAVAGPGQQPAPRRLSDDDDNSLFESGEIVLGDVPDREGVDDSVKKEGKAEYDATRELLHQWGGFNARSEITQYPPERAVKWMLHVAECLEKPNHGIRNQHALLVSYITGQDTPPPSSGAPPAPKYQWLWDEAAALGIIDPQPEPYTSPEPSWGERGGLFSQPTMSPAERLKQHAIQDKAFSIAMSQLEIQFDRASFNMWLKDMVPIRKERNGDELIYTIAAPNDHTLDMLRHRLNRNVQTVLSDAAEQPVTIRWADGQDAINQANQAVAIA